MLWADLRYYSLKDLGTAGLAWDREADRAEASPWDEATERAAKSSNRTWKQKQTETQIRETIEKYILSLLKCQGRHGSTPNEFTVIWRKQKGYRGILKCYLSSVINKTAFKLSENFINCLAGYNNTRPPNENKKTKWFIFFISESRDSVLQIPRSVKSI